MEFSVAKWTIILAISDESHQMLNVKYCLLLKTAFKELRQSNLKWPILPGLLHAFLFNESVLVLFK